MTLTINLTPQNEERLIQAARQNGVSPSDLAQRLIELSLPPATSVDEVGDFGGKTLGDIVGDLLGSVSGKYTDMARHPEKYMDGFGEPGKRMSFNDKT